MASIDDHGKEANSTTSILDSLKNEDALPDYLLSPESPIKKKRDAKQFFDYMCYMVMMESFLLYENFIVFMENQIEKNKREEEIIEEYYSMHTPSHQAPLAAVIPTLMNTLTHEQYQRLEEILYRFKKCMDFLDKKLQKIDQLINEQEMEVRSLQHLAHESRKKFVTNWIDHAERRSSDPDFEPIRIDIAIPDRFKHLPNMDQYKGYIELNKNDYLQFHKAIDRFPVHLLHKAFKEVSQELAAKKLNEALSFVPVDQRNEIIREQTNKPEIYSKISKECCHEISNKKELVDQRNAACKSEKMVAVAQFKESMLKGFKSNLIKEISEKENEITEFVSTAKKPLVQDKKLSRKFMDNKIDSIDMLVTDLESKVNSIDDVPNLKVNTIDSVSSDVDDILSELDNLVPNENCSEAEQNDIVNKLDTIHHKSDDLLEVYQSEALGNNPSEKDEVKADHDKDSKLDISF